MNAISENRKKVNPSLGKAALRNAVLLAVGGGGYYLAEVLYRGYSHWSMAVCGGVCLLSIYHMNKRMSEQGLLLRALAGAGLITAVELTCGSIVNLALDMNVWDYSHMPFNLLGQICLPFSLLWFAVCIPVCALCSKTSEIKSRRE